VKYVALSQSDVTRLETINHLGVHVIMSAPCSVDGNCGLESGEPWHSGLVPVTGPHNSLAREQDEEMARIKRQLHAQFTHHGRAKQ
jgi:hypothetical protein